MNDEDDDGEVKQWDKVIRPNFSPSSIRSRLQQEQRGNESPAKAETPGADAGAATQEKDDPLPRPGDEYKVHGFRGRKPDLTIHFVTRDFAYEGFSYANLDRVRLVPGQKPGGGPVMILRFGDTEVTLEGRHLHSLYNWIGLHRVPWVWEHPSPADFADDKATLVSRIDINQIER